jgi:hypothetical protein
MGSGFPGSEASSSILQCKVPSFSTKSVNLSVNLPITYYGSGFRVYTPWQNVGGLENASQLVPMSVSWAPRLIGFKLREHAIVGMKLEKGRRQGRAVIETDWWYPASMRARYAGFFLIDEIFRERQWQQGELGAYLHQYAPQMFERETPAK